MKKQDIIDKLRDIEINFKTKYIKNNFLNYMNELKNGEDYYIYTKDLSSEKLLELLNFILESDKKSINEFNIKELMLNNKGRFSAYLSRSLPYIDINKNHILLNIIKLETLSDVIKPKEIEIYIKFNKDENHLKYLNEVYNDGKKIYKDMYYNHSFEGDLREVLKTFPKAEDFLNHIKDMDEFKNLYKYLNE